ncbi:MAG: Fe-S-containing hydro-lyase [Candidatus Marinimicrobia bacterium]|nr:Fe-S-containing hydro-lyase [Candidatus Neomarinimicrobiota bacterium]
MSNKIILKPPLENKDIEKLKIGDQVLITGKIYAARDAAHKRLAALIEKDQELPFDIRGQIIYYVGPTPAKPGKPIGAAGPTTSYRMDPYSPLLMKKGLKAMIGKGPRSQEVIDSMIENKAVYLVSIGGAAVVTAQSIQAAKVIAYEDLGPEALQELEVENLPVFVANDIQGRDLFQEGVEKYKK